MVPPKQPHGGFPNLSPPQIISIEVSWLWALLQSLLLLGVNVAAPLPESAKHKREEHKVTKCVYDEEQTDREAETETEIV